MVCNWQQQNERKTEKNVMFSLLIECRKKIAYTQCVVLQSTAKRRYETNIQIQSAKKTRAKHYKAEWAQRTKIRSSLRHNIFKSRAASWKNVTEPNSVPHGIGRSMRSCLPAPHLSLIIWNRLLECSSIPSMTADSSYCKKPSHFASYTNQLHETKP